MYLAGDIVLIVVGVVLIGGSRLIADNFRIPGNTSTFIKFAGLADDYVSRLYRWCTAVLTGAVFVAVGVADLVS
jgi:hypothetical protein